MHVGTLKMWSIFRKDITQADWKILSLIAKSDNALNERLLTISPDVSGTTSLGARVNSKKLFSRNIRLIYSKTKIYLDGQMGIWTRRTAF